MLQLPHQLPPSTAKRLAVLIDPDKASEEHLKHLCHLSNEEEVDFLFVGGSIVAEGDTHKCVQTIKKYSNIPCVLFPGDSTHLSESAEAILLLSLLSGRNPDYLIGKHIEAAPNLAKSDLEIIPTGYLLVDGGKVTAAQYVSQTLPIPRHQNELARITALAGQQMGMKCIYMDAGSGALQAIPVEMIRNVSETIDIPLIIGGGMRKPAQIKAAWLAGANVAVIGNAFEDDPTLLRSFVQMRNEVSDLVG